MMPRIYTCHGETSARCPSWEGTIESTVKQSVYERKVNARGSYFHLIVGAYSDWNFLCIPNWGIGIELSRLSDRFWNHERLRQSGLSPVDASSIADALIELDQHLEL